MKEAQKHKKKYFFHFFRQKFKSSPLYEYKHSNNEDKSHYKHFFCNIIRLPAHELRAVLC